MVIDFSEAITSNNLVPVDSEAKVLDNPSLYFCSACWVNLESGFNLIAWLTIDFSTSFIKAFIIPDSAVWFSTTIILPGVNIFIKAFWLNGGFSIFSLDFKPCVLFPSLASTLPSAAPYIAVSNFGLIPVDFPCSVAGSGRAA